MGAVYFGLREGRTGDRVDYGGSEDLKVDFRNLRQKKVIKHCFASFQKSIFEVEFS